MSGPHPQFSPACPIPYILHPTERVEQLKAFLQTDFGKAQRVNVEALIRLYENGELGPRQRSDPPIYLVEGRRVERNPWEDESVPNNAMRWCEVYFNIHQPTSYPFYWFILMISLDVRISANDPATRTTGKYHIIL